VSLVSCYSVRWPYSCLDSVVCISSTQRMLVPAPRGGGRGASPAPAGSLETHVPPTSGYCAWPPTLWHGRTCWRAHRWTCPIAVYVHSIQWIDAARIDSNSESRTLVTPSPAVAPGHSAIPHRQTRVGDPGRSPRIPGSLSTSAVPSLLGPGKADCVQGGRVCSICLLHVQCVALAGEVHSSTRHTDAAPTTAL